MPSHRVDEFGEWMEHERFQVVLGTKLLTLEGLRQHLPQVEFRSLKQIHSSTIHDWSTVNGVQEIQADAHLTDQANQGLCIFTADCIPLILYCPTTHRVAAIHAGWRGVASEIVPKTISQLVRSGSKGEDLLIFVGAHIRFDQFEVHRDVGNQILQTIAEKKKALRGHTDPTKVFIDLLEVVRQQLAPLGVRPSQLQDNRQDTTLKPIYASFRRDGVGCGRNISVAILKSK